ncbi:hypothetical protein VM98_13390 [Streptomyces rubellomurinus subsp. indigoferus]|nr:hypothetical protein VM98_13390 [Streptomyces rubellomurinus subsp. indigoferus]
MSGVAWDSGNFKLWGGQAADVILFSPKQPMLARSATTGRYEAACTEFRAQKDNTYQIIGGAASFTATSAIQADDSQLAALKDQWRQTLAGAQDAPQNPIFVPLNTRKGQTALAIPAVSGTVSDLTAKANDAGTPGGTVTYLADLTAYGAQEWADAIRNGRSPVAQVMLSYEYLRYMPQCSVEILMHGDRVFQHFSGELKASYDGWLYGGSVDIQAQLESLRADSSIEMKFYGLDDLPGGMEKIKESVTNTIIDQGLKALLGMLFQPKPDVKPAVAGSSGGIFGGANLALKWQRAEQAADITTKLEFGGFTWLTERADVDLSIFAALDDSYVTTVNTELQFPSTITVVGNPQVASTAVALDYSEGQAPQSPVFLADGGSKSYVVTSAAPDNVTVHYDAKINYAPGSWPIVDDAASGTVKQGFGNILIKPSQWVGSTTIYLYVKNAAAKGIQLINPTMGNDYLVVNVTYTSPGLTQPIKASTKLTMDTPVTFSYPISPGGQPGTATFSAFGIIGGKLVHAAEQPLGINESAVFVLVSDTGVQLISDAAVLAEDDATAQDLLRKKDNVVVTGGTGDGKQGETTKAAAGNGAGHLKGTLVGVEYDDTGAWLLIDSPDGRHRLALHSDRQAARFTEREAVDVALDPAGAVARVTVELPA